MPRFRGGIRTWIWFLKLKFYYAKRDGGSKTANRVGHPRKICSQDGSNSVRNNRIRFETKAEWAFREGLPSKYGVGPGSKQKDGGSKTANRAGHPRPNSCPDGSNSVRNNGMTVRKRQTAWDVIAKIVVSDGSNSVRNNGKAVRKRQTAWAILTKMVVLTVPRRFETLDSSFERFVAMQKRAKL